MDDPLVNNATPAWGNIGQVTGCQSNLEVGDPLTGTAFTATLNGFTYHPQELVFFSWFSRDVPSSRLTVSIPSMEHLRRRRAACP
jgi:hypothetical protein